VFKNLSGVMFEDDEFFRRMRRWFREYEREFDRAFKGVDFRELERMPGARGFKIEVRDFGRGRPEVKVTRIGERPEVVPVEEAPPKPEVKPKPKPITRALETNVGKVEKLDEVILTIQAPGVSKEDVEVRRLGATLEVLARKPTGEAYFAAFELPPDALPEQRTVEVKEGVVVITVPRRRYPRVRA